MSLEGYPWSGSRKSNCCEPGLQIKKLSLRKTEDCCLLLKASRKGQQRPYSHTETFLEPFAIVGSVFQGRPADAAFTRLLQSICLIG